MSESTYNSVSEPTIVQPTRGRKQCPNCMTITGVRQKICKCGHEFTTKLTDTSLQNKLDDVSQEGVTDWLDRLIENQFKLIILNGIRAVAYKNYPELYSKISQYIKEYVDGKCAVEEKT